MKLPPPLLACCLVLLVAGCSGGPTPEELILLRIDEAVEAAESRDMPALKGFLADEHCEAFSPEFEDETEDEDGESTTVGPFITFD